MSKEADGSSCREDYADDKGWTIVVESESLKVGKSLKIGENRKNRICYLIRLFGKDAKMP